MSDTHTIAITIQGNEKEATEALYAAMGALMWGGVPVIVGRVTE